MSYAVANDMVIITLDDDSQKTVPVSALMDPVVYIIGERGGYRQDRRTQRRRETC